MFHFDDLDGLMKSMQELFTCPRSGYCCSAFFVVGVPGYNKAGEWTGDLTQRGPKLDNQRCRHLESAKIVDGKWQLAACKIHDEPALYPADCKNFFIGTGPCALGIPTWKMRKERNPESELPDHVKKISGGD